MDKLEKHEKDQYCYLRHINPLIDRINTLADENKALKKELNLMKNCFIKIVPRPDIPEDVAYLVDGSKVGMEVLAKIENIGINQGE